MIIESGAIVFMGLLLMFLKLSWQTRLRLFGKPLLLDIIVSALTLMIHWGTFSGVMAATVAGLMTSGFTGAGKKFFGYIDSAGYHPGITDVSAKISKEIRHA
jgi:hypothetical protein